MTKSTGFTHKLSSKTFPFLPEIILIALFCFVQLSHINIDFWNDEIYTLKHFVFTSPINTVSDYHVPNNHILFNLINNIYLKIIGVDSLHDLFDSPWKLRLVPFVFSFFTVFFTYQIGRKFIHRSAGLIAAIVLITTLSYYNFSLQIRGYGLSTMICVLLIYYLLAYLKNQQRSTILTMSILVCLLFYSIPSNLYFILAVLLVLGCYTLRGSRTVKAILVNKYSFAIYAIIAGMLTALLLYSPVITEIFSNKYVSLGDPFSLSALSFNLINIGSGLIYNPWLTLLVVAGLLIGCRSLFRLTSIWFSISIVITPLFIIWVSGQQPPPRIFTFSIPFLSLFMGASLYFGWKKLASNSGKNDWIMITVILLVSTFSMFQQLDNVEKKMLSDIKTGGRTQDMYHQYYSARYWPLQDMKTFKSVYSKNKLPVIIVGCEDHGIPNYLEKFDIPYSSQLDLDSVLMKNERIYVITNHPFKLVERNDISATILNSNLSYHNSLLVTKK